MTGRVRRRSDTDGCGCVRCCSLDPALLRRSLGGDLLWGARLLARRPSIPLLALALFLVIGLLDPLWARTTQPISAVDVPIEGVVFLALLGIVLRSYTAVVAADVVTDQTTDRRSRLGRTLRRTPAVAVVLALTVAAAFLALAVASQLVWLLLQVGFAVDGALGLGVVSDTIFDGPEATLIFGSVMSLAAVKFWLAPEIAVVGNYRPWTAMRVSWAITRAHRLRLLAVVIGFAATVFGPQLLAGLGSALGTGGLAGLPGLELLGFYLQALLAAVWFAVGTQIYLRAAVHEPTD